MTREQILHEALEEIANPIAAMQRRAAAEGKRLDGMGCVALSKDPGYLITLARDALDKARRLPVSMALPPFDPTSMLLMRLDALLRDLEPEDNGEGACCDPNAVLNIVGEARRLIREFNKR